MMGDYYRYIAESVTIVNLDDVKKGATEAYEEANKHLEPLNPCNPIKLGQALSYSVYYHEVMND